MSRHHGSCGPEAVNAGLQGGHVAHLHIGLPSILSKLGVAWPTR